MKTIQQAKANVKISVGGKLEEKQKYSHIIVAIPKEKAWANIQVKTEDEGIVVDIFNYKGEVVDSVYLFYDELNKPLSIAEDKQ